MRRSNSGANRSASDPEEETEIELEGIDLGFSSEDVDADGQWDDVPYSQPDGYISDADDEMEVVGNSLTELSRAGDLEQVQDLLRQWPDVIHTEQAHDAFVIACTEGHLPLAKWLWSQVPGLERTHIYEFAFSWTCTSGHLEVAQWLWSLEGIADKQQIDMEQIFQDAYCDGHPQIAEWLWSFNQMAKPVGHIYSGECANLVIKNWPSGFVSLRNPNSIAGMCVKMCFGMHA